MITQLHTPIGCYVPELEMEGYIHFVIDCGGENYVYFIVIMDNGEFWILDNRKVRGTVNYTTGRYKINKEKNSEFISKLKKDEQEKTSK